MTNRFSTPHKSNPQTGYTVHKLDALIDTVVRGLFTQLQDVPKEAIMPTSTA